MQVSESQESLRGQIAAIGYQKIISPFALFPPLEYVEPMTVALNQKHPCCCAPDHGTAELIQGKEQRRLQEISQESCLQSF